MEKVYINVNNLSTKTVEEKEKIAEKLHKQFGDATGDKLCSLIKSSKYRDHVLLEKVKGIEQRCNTCLKYKKPALRPVVGLSLAKDFNEVVAMDLKDIRGKKILHMIDHATRYAAAAVVKSKEKGEIVDKIFRHWIALFEPPRKILCDNGGEFNNELMRNLGEMLNIELRSTAVEAPWSNGMVERHNGILATMTEKVMDDNSCTLEVCWAISAKNALHNSFGFSPNQLVFGKNPNTPSVLHDNSPAMEGVTPSKLIASHLNAMNRARKAFIESETSEKLRRALRKKTRNITSEIFQQGDKVYYKRNNSKLWKGPGMVIGSEDKQVIVKHGGYLIRVHSCSLQHVNWKKETMGKSSYEDIQREEESVSNVSVYGEVGNTVSAHRTKEYEEREGIEVPVTEDEWGLQTQVDENFEQTPTVDELIYEALQKADEVESPIVERADKTTDLVESPEIEEVIVPAEVTEPEVEKPTIQSGEKPRVKSTVWYHDAVSNKWRHAMVIGRAGKVGGRNEYWFNVKDIKDGSNHCVNFEATLGWKYSNEEVLITGSFNKFDIETAKQMELDNWNNLKVYEEVPFTGQSLISVRWVLTEKYINGNSTIKAHLVARGFEEPNLDAMRKDSPTCCKENFRILLAIIAVKHWKVYTLDVKSAFLQCNAINRGVFIKPPREATTENIWKLLITVYGLCDAPRAWYLTMKQFLENLQVIKSRYDDAVFYWMCEGTLQGIISCHVDDFIWGGTVNFEENVIQLIKSKFQISKSEGETFNYLGLTVSQESIGIKITQKIYIEELKEVSIAKERKLQKLNRLNDMEAQQLWSIAGQLNWVSG